MNRKRQSKQDINYTGMLKIVLAVIREIREGGYPNKNTLAETIDRDPRTAGRIIRALKQEFGAPIEYDYDSRGFYFSDKKWRLDK